MKRVMVALIAVLASTGVWADTWKDPDTGYTWTYRINGDTAEIFNDYSCAISPKPTGTVTIPSTLGGKPVTSIGSSAFSGCSGLTSVTIPDSITSIGSGAFSGCSGLTSVTIPDSITSIGSSAFSGCSGLTSVTIPDSVTNIGEYAFSNTPFYNNQPDGLVVFGKVAYKMKGNCPASVTIPDGVTTIGKSAFYRCSGLTSVTIPDSVTTIGSYAFYNCSGLTSVRITDIARWCGIVFGSETGNPLCYAHNLYLNGSLVTELTIPDGVTTIGSYAFYGCDGLTSVTIPDGVTTIGSYAFYGCDGLTSVTIPDSVTSIGGSAFTGTPFYNNQLDGLVVFGRVAHKLKGNCPASVTIPSGVTSIGDRAFSDCRGLTSVTIPSGVTSIGSYAFYNCTGLSCVMIPDSVTDIGGEAFYGCDGLTSVTLFGSVTFNANGGCVWPATRTVADGAAVEVIPLATRDGYTFDGWFTAANGGTQVSLETVVTGDVTYYAHWTIEWRYTVSDGKVMLGILPACAGSEPAILPSVTGAIVIPSTLDGYPVTSIGSGAFSYCDGLTSVTIPDSVTSIGEYAFSGCSGLTSVTLPNSVTSIGECAFSGCSGLTSVTIPDGVTRIGYGAFEGCSGLTSVTIPSSVTSIGGSAFYATPFYDNQPDGLVVFGRVAYKMKGNCPASVTIPDGVTSIGSSAFSGCSGLTSVTIPDSITSIGSGAFSGCSGLTSVTIPDSITSIGSVSFSGCSGLTSVTIPDSVMRIGYGAFEGCSGLTSVTIPDSVTTIVEDAFYGCGDSLFDTNSIPGVKLVDGWAVGYTESLSGNLDLTGVRGVGDYAFYGCSGLTSVTIGNGVASIGSYAFADCENLTSVTIGNGVTSIGGEAFWGCIGLTRVHISDLAAWCGISFSGYDSNPLSYAHNLYLNDALVTNLTIPDCVTSIGAYAFFGCSELTRVTIPSTVDYIGAAAFFDPGRWGWNYYDDGNRTNEAIIPVQVVIMVGDHPVTVSCPVVGLCGGGDDYYPAIPEENSVEYVPMDGYCFFGWKDANGDVVERPFHQRQVVTLYPDLRGVERTVTFDANCARVQMDMSDKVVTNGCMVGELPAPVREGYALDGWFTATQGGEMVTEETVVTNDVTFYAQWTINQYVVTFDANGGVGGVTNEQDFASEVVAPTVTRTGYTFAGWTPSAGTTVPASNVTYTAQWKINQYAVAFDANGGVGGVTNEQDFASEVVAPTVTRTGYTFAGWTPSVGTTVPVSNVMYTAQWTINQYVVTFDANGGKGGWSRLMDYGAAIVAPTVTYEGCTFVGWSSAVPATVPVGGITVVAQWEKDAPVLFEEVDGVAPATAASEYNGCLVDADGNVKGTIQVKVGKPNAKTGLAAVSATVVIGAKKVTLKAADKGKAEIASDGPTEIELVGKGAEECTVVLGAEGLSGSYGSYLIDGARNFFASKDKSEASDADKLVAGLVGSYNLAWSGGVAVVTVAKKGKVKVSGTLANGTKLTANSQLLIGEEWFCVPVAIQKANLSFVLWISRDGGDAAVEGLGGDAVLGRPGTLKTGATFNMDSAALGAALGMDVLPYLPDGLSVEQKGTKWVVADGAKAGKITMKKGVVDDSKAGANPSGLKLTYKAKDGTFKGSFKVYSEANGKLTTTTVNVAGILINGVGYGTATCKKPPVSWPVTVK